MMQRFSSLKPKFADIPIVACIAMTASVFGSKPAYLLALIIAIAYLAKNAFGDRWLVKQFARFYAFAIVLFSFLIILAFAFLPNDKVFSKYFPRIFHIERLHGDSPGIKRIGTITAIGLSAKASSTIHDDLFVRFACSESMEEDYRNYLKYRTRINEFNPWIGRKVLCSSLWLTLTYANNSKCVAYDDAIVFDSIKISNSRYAFEIIKGDSSFVGLYNNDARDQ